MNSKKTTPPHIISNPKKVIFSYDEKKFAKTISRITEDILPHVRISVFAKEDRNGQCENILASNLSDKEFDLLAKKATYTLYEGHPKDLEAIGVC